MITETDPRFAATVFAVEATNCELFMLWKQHNDKVDWKQGTGLLCQIGVLDNRPVCVTAMFENLNGHTVLFYEPSSQVVDWRMVEEWLNHNVKAKWDNGTRRAHCDAMNFHHCIQALEQLK